MGCLKLTYQTTETPLNVVYRKPSFDKNIAQRFLSVEPLAEQREWLSPYNFVQNNPINRIDPTGALDDWVERDGNIVWDENVTRANDVDLQTGDKYLGKQGYDLQTYYHSDGTTSPISFTLNEAIITGVMLDHARTMSNPIVQSIHRAQGEFLKAAWENPGTQALLWIVPGTQLTKGIGIGLANVSTRLGTRIATKTMVQEGVTLASTFKGNIRLGFSMGGKVSRYVPLDDVAAYGINSSKAFSFRGNAMFTTKFASTSAKDIYWNLGLNYSTHGGRAINYFGTSYSRFQARQFGFYIKGTVGPQHGGLGGGATQYVGLKGGIKYFGL